MIKRKEKKNTSKPMIEYFYLDSKILFCFFSLYLSPYCRKSIDGYHYHTSKFISWDGSDQVTWSLYHDLLFDSSKNHWTHWTDNIAHTKFSFWLEVVAGKHD